MLACLIVALLAVIGQGALNVVSAAMVNVAEMFAVSISITGATGLTSRVNPVLEGSLDDAFGSIVFVPDFVDNTSGLISLVAATYLNLPPDPSGDGSWRTST